jgi:two-component system, OmpR family, sensor histidine kinase KdpD
MNEPNERYRRWREWIEQRRRLGGWLASVVLLAVVTAAIELLKHHVPVLSLAVLYILAVLPVAIGWGLAYAVPVAVASMLTFNFLFLPPLYTFTLADSRNWFALLVFVVTAVVVSDLAARSRRRARESELLARVATSLLEQDDVSAALDDIAAEAAAPLEVERARILVGEQPITSSADQYPLVAAGRRVGTLTLEQPRGRSSAARRRLVPALASLLAVAIDRERLAREALEAETLRRRDAMTTAVLRAVSHDLRSPLMAILTSAGALAREDFALEARERDELVATILTEAERLDRLVGNLLDLSRLQAGAFQPEPGVWAVDDLVVQALEDVGAGAERVDVSFPNESPAVRADAHQIQRVLANLIENALRYSPAAERVGLTVDTVGAEVLVRVIDRGPGIEPGELEPIFEPFHRGAVARGPGAGLGLAIARGFAGANGGRVWAESRAGQGATFVLALPVAQVEAQVSA